MKQITIFAADGVTPAPAFDFGSVPPGTTAPSRQLVLKNTGTDPIPSIKGAIERASSANGTYTVTIGGVTLTTADTELLSAPLAVNGTIAVTEQWATPVGVASSAVEYGLLVFKFYL
ncbi:hypothetical protein Q0M94_11895 [Deinococcus radiomollis]|uniref:hypothetical protein n=1 Tax=Deinococcus radiomollis TaxID=468916 RepID=UPI003892AE7E